MKDIVKELSLKIKDKLIRIRRHLHAHPELSFQESETSAFIKKILDEAKIPWSGGWAGHGIVVQLEGGKTGDGNVIALRADMDALPIQEENSVDYKSIHPGVMHACGHDVHTTCLIGALLILHSIKDQWSGKVKAIFQPGEEKLPGGASMMIKEGVLKNPTPNLMIAQHVHPSLEVGKVGIRYGNYMASADEIYITVKGKGGHGGLPHLCLDPVVVTAGIIEALQSIVSRNSDPTIPTVLTFGKIYSKGGATNIIPDEVCLEGTFRTMDENWRRRAHSLIKERVNCIAKSMGTSAEINIRVGYPTLYNDLKLSQKVQSIMIEYLGEQNVEELPVRMTAEDFAFYSLELPACFYRLGTGNRSKNITSPVHTSTFDIDEDALEVGSGLMAYLALKCL
ncbi:MAG TPA: M20 family metallopeptidase [Saprospiraceae bacterium]|nr:M20 family metallopeptidase [Saprospiraceae bacterium]